MRPADIPAGGFISCGDVSKYSDESAGNETITRDVERHEVLLIMTTEQVTTSQQGPLNHQNG